jgi:hypothetical protein
MQVVGAVTVRHTGLAWVTASVLTGELDWFGEAVGRKWPTTVPGISCSIIDFRL